MIGAPGFTHACADAGTNFSSRCSKAIRRLQFGCRKQKLRARRNPVMHCIALRGLNASVTFGLLANAHKAVRLATCRALFGLPAPAPAVLESVDAFMARVAQLDLTRCHIAPTAACG